MRYTSRTLFCVTLRTGVVVNIVADTLGDIDAIIRDLGWSAAISVEHKGDVYIKE